MADISLAVDVPLMHTIAQASATFIAIIAGFYTNKVLSILSDRKRIEGKLREMDSEIDLKRKTIQELTKNINDIHEVWAKGIVEAFKDYMSIRTKAIEDLSSADDLRKHFEDYIEREPTEEEERIFAEKCPSMFEDLKKTAQNRNGSEVRWLPPYGSPAQEYSKVLSNRDEIRNRDELYDRIETQEDRISALTLSKNDFQKELNYLAFPKNMKFGFCSFVIFAIFGVIFPLTYNLWGAYILSDPNLIYLLAHIDNVAVLLFCIGLALTFIYIGLELRHALGSKKNVSLKTVS